MLDLGRLSAAQREAVLAGEGPLLILAGPGSGKTTVLAARIAHLVLARGVGPASVLALTFTVAAARTLQARLRSLLGDEQGRSLEVTTFHSLGLRIVRQWATELGYPPGPLSVFGAHEARSLLTVARRSLGEDLAGWPEDELAAALDRFRLRSDSGRRAGDSAQLRALVDAYEALLQRRGAVDYPAMLALPLRLFRERPRALRLYQDAFRHILTDEFQDTCAAQYTLLRLLAERHHNLVVVGDPFQTIYAWRGADVRFLLQFQRVYPDARVVDLTQNFRSTGRLVDLANALGAPLGYRAPLWTENPPGTAPLVFAAPDEAAEAAFVADEIERLRADRLVGSLSEIGILYRTNRQVQELGVALRTRRLPYRVRGSADLFCRREVRDAVAYLRLAHNPADGEALARILNAPPRRLGRLAETLQEHPVSASELLSRGHPLGPRPRRTVEALVGLVAQLHAAAAHQTPAELLDFALDQSGYRAWLKEQRDGAARLEYLAALRTLAARADDLGMWLAELQLGEDTEPAGDSPDQVVLTTIHQAKGDEWRAVFVVGIEEGLLPHPRAFHGSTAESGPSGLDEERRLAYVAVTRPRERLYLTYCRARRLGQQGEPKPRRPSRFLCELPGGLLTRAA